MHQNFGLLPNPRVCILARCYQNPPLKVFNPFALLLPRFQRDTSGPSALLLASGEHGAAIQFRPSAGAYEVYVVVNEADVNRAAPMLWPSAVQDKSWHAVEGSHAIRGDLTNTERCQGRKST